MAAIRVLAGVVAGLRWFRVRRTGVLPGFCFEAQPDDAMTLVTLRALQRTAPPNEAWAAPERRPYAAEDDDFFEGWKMDLIYSVAASLDGYIAGPNGEYDWIMVDPEIDFEAMYAGFSGIVMGRRSYDVFAATGGAPGPALPTYVYSTTLPEGERNGIQFIRDAIAHVRTLKAGGNGKPLWLWGGGNLFRQLADAALVDGVQVAIVPVILGGGLPLIAPGTTLRLELHRHRVYKTSGIVFAEYNLPR